MFKRLKLVSVLCFLLLVSLLTACTGDPSDKELVEKAQTALTLENIDAVTENLTLPTTGLHGTTITWVSDKPAVISNTGTVTRPQNGDGDATVKLTATIKLNKASLTKDFTVTVKEMELTDQQKVDSTKSSLDLGDLSAVITDLTLPTEGAQGTVITWASSNPMVITKEGVVTRPAFGEGSKTITLTATIQSNEVTDTKEFTATVPEAPQTDADKVSEARTSLQLEGDLTQVKADLTLPQTGLYDSTITWSSNKPEVISNEGVVTRGNTNQLVRLTATITLNGESKTKDFVITVMQSDESIVNSAKEALNLGNLDSVTQNLTLPAEGEKGTTITWSSNKKDVISDAGVVTRPENGNGNATVILTATISFGEYQDTKEFTAVVLEEPFDAQAAVDEVKENLSLGDLSNVIETLTLPTVESGTTITWSSTEPGIITPEGTVRRPLGGMGWETEVTVTLTATITYNDATAEKEFEATVPVDTEKQTISVTEALNGDDVNVLVRGIVTAIAQTKFVLQDENDPTKNILVSFATYRGIKEVAVGDYVAVAGLEKDYYNVPEVKSLTAIYGPFKMGQSFETVVMPDLEVLHHSDLSAFGKTYVFEGIFVTAINSSYIEFFVHGSGKMGLPLWEILPSVDVSHVEVGDIINLTATLYGLNNTYITNANAMWRFMISSTDDIEVVFDKSELPATSNEAFVLPDLEGITWSSTSPLFDPETLTIALPEEGHEAVEFTASINRGGFSSSQNFTIGMFNEPITVTEAKTFGNDEPMLVKGIVSAVNSVGFVIQDPDGTGLYINLAEKDLQVGDEIVVSGLSGVWREMVQINDRLSYSTPTTSGNEVVKFTKTLEELSAEKTDLTNYGKTFVFENVTITNITNDYLFFYDSDGFDFGLYLKEQPEVDFSNLNVGDTINMTATLYSANNNFTSATIWRFSINSLNDITVVAQAEAPTE